MGNRIDTRVVLGSLRYKSAPDTNLFFQVPLVQSTKESTEFDRSIDIGLEQLYDDERQKSDIFRPIAKFSLIFKNSYAGIPNYTPFENNLYYLNAIEAAKNNCPPDPNVSWTGLPQYNEFDFIRNDYNVTGYTQPPSEHLIFVPKSASTYNWNFFVTYAYENSYTKPMRYQDNKTTPNININWLSGDGIPFIINQDNYNGLGRISFRCPVKHGLSVGEYVKLSFSYNGVDLFIVDSLGAETAGSEEYVFNIINVGYTGSTFNIGTTGTFKRVILNSNTADTISRYYVRRHKVLTNPQDAALVKAGFEENIFGISKKYEPSAFTPNKVARVSVKEGAQSYTLSFDKDILINPLLDNEQRPVSELFMTVIWKGYFGWTWKGLKQGWEFNLPLQTNGSPSTFWQSPISNYYINSGTTLPISNWTNSGGDFKYVTELKEGDVIDGDYCEFNEYEQKERVISNLFHKFIFNPTHFSILLPQGVTPQNPFGYYYQPHHSIKIRDYSGYIEDGDIRNVVGIPNYAYFSTTRNLFIWRDLYPYGFIDGNGIGVNYPFFNGAHYPYGDFIFRIIPEGTNYIEQTIIADPTIDNCE